MKRTELEKMLKRLAWVIALLAVAVLIVSAVEQKRESEAKQLQIDIENLPSGNTLIDQRDIRVIIERSFGNQLEGLPLGVLDLDRVERVLESDPFILNADVFIDAQNIVHVEATQRQPFLRIIDGNGKNYYLDEFGQKILLSKHYSPRVLVATGNIPPFNPDFLEKKRNTIKDLFLLGQLILEDKFMSTLVEQLYVDGENDIIMIPKIGKQKIIFGGFERAEEKIKKLKIFYKEGMPYSGWKRYKTIDLRYKKQVVCK